MRKAFYLIIIVLVSSCVNNNEQQKISLLDNASLGIDFENRLEYTEDFNVYLFRSFYNGSGVGLSDLNDDGNLDLFLCGNQERNKLYLGDGNFNFKDVSEQSGIHSSNSWTTGVSIADINGDGLKDIYVCKSGKLEDENRRNELFINTGNDDNGIPVFVESAKEYGIDDSGFSIHAVFFDYDRDGDLDMYLSNNSSTSSDLIVDSSRGAREKKDSGGGNKLYKNTGSSFEDVTDSAGIYSSIIGYGLGVSIGDVNRDGWPDIYVANDFFEKDYLYINNQNGTFTESIDETTTEISLGSMGVDISDLNHDGYPEIFVTEMLPSDEGRLKTKALFDNWDKYQLKVKNGYHRQFPRNSFQLNNKAGLDPKKVTFSEISRYSGTAASDWSWGVLMMDLDNNGEKEIFVTNGIVKDLLDLDYLDFYDNSKRLASIRSNKGDIVMTELLDNMPSEPISNHLYKLKKDLKYTEVADDFGIAQKGFSTGSSYGDIDNDGDLDLVVNNINAAPFIYRNNSETNGKHFISLTLKDNKGRVAIGAQVSLWSQGKLFYEELWPMRGSMSVVDDRIHVGLGGHNSIDSLKIRWPDGSVETKRKITINKFLTIAQNSTKEEVIDNQFIEGSVKQKFYEWRNDSVVFTHNENEFVDFDRDKLLFHMRSNEGPCVAVADLNNDGLEDFFVGGAKGQAGKIFLQEASSFKSSSIETFLNDKESEDQSAIFFDFDKDGDKDLIVASGSYEFSPNSYTLNDRLYINDGDGNFSKDDQPLRSGQPTSSSVVVNADFDNDGDEDLFFGSRFVPGYYGLIPQSFLLENDGKGHFTDVSKEKLLGYDQIGMITDAKWTDLNGDGLKDLIIVGEWMPVKIFLNIEGKLVEKTADYGLAKSNGFWNTVEVADLDNDGDNDLVLGNLGQNTFLKSSVDKPVRMWVNDFDKNGSIEQILTSYDGENSFPFAQKKEITKQMPHLLKKYLKHEDYKYQTVEDIFTASELKKALKHEVFETSSCIFWNEGKTFTRQKLPFLAQMTPIYSILIEDINKDSLLDIITGGNQYRVKPQIGIYAAGNGNILLNQKDRNFIPNQPIELGLNLSKEIRDMEKIQIGGKPCYLIIKNNDSLKIFCEE